MMFSRDPLTNPEELIRRVYAYVAYRIGEGADAEDVTSETFERALRYRASYDARKGEPAAWLIGIARRCIGEALARRSATLPDPPDVPAPGELEEDTVRRLALHDAVDGLDERDRELIALRYGGDLTARQIAELLGMKTNAIEVALHRALARLRALIETEDVADPNPQSLRL
jgi:RNA polymerase sigma factor (sigma-70 family)